MEKQKMTSTEPAETAVSDIKLHYGNGSPVDGQNLTEVQAFEQYAAEKKTVAASKAVLLAYYQQQAA
jgi:hypothetical protein